MIMIGARRCAQHGQRARERTKEWFHACFHLIVKEQVLNGQRTDSTVDKAQEKRHFEREVKW